MWKIIPSRSDFSLTRVLLDFSQREVKLNLGRDTTGCPLHISARLAIQGFIKHSPISRNVLWLAFIIRKHLRWKSLFIKRISDKYFWPTWKAVFHTRSLLCGHTSCWVWFIALNTKNSLARELMKSYRVSKSRYTHQVRERLLLAQGSYSRQICRRSRQFDRSASSRECSGSCRMKTRQLRIL